MSQEPKEWEKELTKKNLFDRLNLSVQELSELGIGWLITSFVILYITGSIQIVIQEMRIPNELLVYLFVLGISFFTHELMHKFTAIKYGAKAYFRLSREALMLMAISLFIGFPILATGAVYWWGEATASPGIRGRVSAAGPISNLILAGFFFILQGIALMMFPDPVLYELASILFFAGTTGVWLNAFLGVFNLLPIGVLDGAKVLAWDPKIWIALIGSLIVVGFFGGGFIPFF